MIRGRKYIAVIILLALVGLAVLFVVLGGSRLFTANAGPQYETAPVTRGDVAAKVGSTGIAHARQTTYLVWKVSGRVAGINVKIGDRVETGQLLAGLDPTSLPPTLLQAKTQLVDAQNALKELRETETSRAQARSNLLNAQKALNDVRAAVVLLDQPNASPSNLEAAQAAYNVSLAQVDAAEQMYSFLQGRPENDVARLQAAAQLERAYKQRDNALINLQYAQSKPNTQIASQVNAQLAVAEANLQEAERAWQRVENGASEDEIRAAELRVESLELTLAQASLNAPIPGTITELPMRVGDVVQTGTLAVRIDDFSERHVIIQVPEVDIVRVKIGQRATLTFDALAGKQYRGEVINVSRVGKMDQGKIEFEVEVRLTNADDSIQPGMTAAVNVIVEERKDVLLIPNRAQRRKDGQQVVYLLHDGELVAVPVTLGLSDEDNSELVSGQIVAGDSIVLNPPASATQPAGN